MDVVRSESGKWVIIHAGREVDKDFDSESDAWRWADRNHNYVLDTTDRQTQVQGMCTGDHRHLPPEIEITSEMIEAGFSVLAFEAGTAGDPLPARFSPREVAAEVYRAMEGVRRKNSGPRRSVD